MPPKRPPTGGGRQSRSASSASGGGSSSDDDGSGDDGSSSSSGSGSSSSGSSSSSSSGSSGSGSSSDSGSERSSAKSGGEQSNNKRASGTKHRSRSKSAGSSAGSSADDKKSRRASHVSSGRQGSRSGARGSRSSSTASEGDKSKSKSSSKKPPKSANNKPGNTSSSKAERRSSKDHRGHHGRKDDKDKDASSQAAVASKAAPKKSATAKTKPGSTFQGGGFQPARSAAGRSNLSEGDTDDSDGMGEFSLIKLAGKSKQQKKVSAIHASMLSSSPGSQASPSTTSGGPNMTPNASIAGSLTPSSLAAGGATITGSSAKTGSSGTTEQLPGSSSSVPQNNIASSANKQGSKKNSNSASSGSAATLGGNTGGGAAGNKKNLSNAEKTSALAKSIFSESSADDSETISVLSKRKTKKGQQSIKAGNNKKGRSPSPPLAASQTATSKRGSNKNKSSTSISQPIIKQEVTTFTSTKASADASSTTSPEKGTTRGRPPKKSAAKMAAEAASKKEQQIKEQQKKKKAQAAAKRKVTRSSSLSSEASGQSSSDSDTSSQAAASGSADTSDDSDSDPEVKLKKASPKETKVNKKAPPKKVKTGATPKGKKETTAHQKKVSSRDLLSSEDESMASTAVSSAAVSPSKVSAKGKKSANGARPNTRQRGGSNMRRSRHVTGKNHAGLIDTDSDMEMTSTANESVGSSPRKKTGRGRYQKSAQKATEKKKTSSFSGDDSQGEDIPKRKSTSVRDRATKVQEAAVTAAKVTERILTSRNLDRQASSPSGEGFGTFNRGSNNSHPAQPPANHHGNASGTYPSEVTLPPVRRTFEGCTPIEDKKCATPGCDSSGHFSGTNKFDYHFTQDACPLYHNTVKKECKDFRIEINKKHSARRKATGMMAGARSPLGSPSTEQKRHAQMVRDAREKFNPKDVPEFGEVPEDREPILTQFTSQWDLKLFREAQALAAEDCENALRGLPETKQTKYIEMGRHEMEVWYQSPYPEEYTSQPKIYICEFCLKYMRSSCQLRRHAAKCVWNHPPGDEIYRKEPLSVFEICGKRYKQYCQSLCLLAKFFLDHKTLYFDVEPFLFYVMTTADSSGCHIVGYFSKEKNSLLNYNVSCILTLPPYQRQGYGRLLIDFSYLLSREEGKIGSPEKPLSDLGLITYRAYWKDVLLEYICNYPEKELSIKAFSEEMGINPGDIISTLQVLGMIKYWKGQHVILKKEDLIDEYLAKSRSRPKHRQIYPGGLKWKPYEPTAKERRQAAQIQKNQDDNRQQKKR